MILFRDDKIVILKSLLSLFVPNCFSLFGPLYIQAEQRRGTHMQYLIYGDIQSDSAWQSFSFVSSSLATLCRKANTFDICDNKEREKKCLRFLINLDFLSIAAVDWQL
uniref:Uncharacterized protein n=1 Tax=Glossina brevipalpis TaxID=37001 RepID=A0A1A9W9G4_9MUSC